MPAFAATALSFDAAIAQALQGTPQMLAARSKLEASRLAAISAGELPDPKLALGVENFPVGGPDRYSLTRDFMTMQRIAVMQEFPNRDKRDARVAVANARIERSEAERKLALSLVQRETALAWIKRYTVERQLAQLDQLLEENKLFADAIRAQLAGGRAAAADAVLPRQEAALLAERRDELLMQQQQANAALQRWVGAAAAAPLAGSPPQWRLEREHLQQEIQQHPDLQLAYATQRMSEAELRDAQAMKKSDWGLEFAYQRRGPQYGDMVSVQLTFELPFFSAKRQDPQIAARLAERDSAQAEREAMWLEHTQELAAGLAEAERLQRAVTRNRDVQQPLAREKIELSFAAYRGGKASLSDVIAARREALEVQLKLSALEGELQALQARLHYATEHQEPGKY
ncbi:MAG: TolC family protein [Burkholderiales bacterium]|nr:TolC family protein [Burkholderiales bacterium]